ncbi:MAG: alginate lyase family protein [Bacteroidetes bacterium]|nr:alginate lyase family protein [Bacteroidota bacterium]
MKRFKVIAILWIYLQFLSTLISASNPKEATKKEVINLLRKEIILKANQLLKEKPQTITEFTCPRSAGGKNDFYSEGDYWWPDPKDPNGPFIQRDGLTNPENFVSHRKAMIRFSQTIGTLASAYKITGDEKYVNHAQLHLKAWFVNNDTKMNPSLLYAQAIKGRFTGRGIGIIDGIQLMEVAQGIRVMQNAPGFDKKLLLDTKKWFSDFLQWLTTHQYGKDEMNAQNNHGTCWAMQVASFSRFTENNELLDFCRNRYKEVFLPKQMAENGSFPLELKRTKPYGYSLFNLDAMTMLCQILSDKDHDLWNYTTPDGKCIRKGIEYIYPFVEDKSKWQLPPDVMYWDNWPVAQPFLLFGATVFQKAEWLECWKRKDHFPKTEEVIRNLPIRNPIIWLE